MSKNTASWEDQLNVWLFSLNAVSVLHCVRPIRVCLSVCARVPRGSYHALVRGPSPIRSISLTSALSPCHAFELNASGKALGQHKPPELQRLLQSLSSLSPRSDLTLRASRGPSQALTLSIWIRGPCSDSNLSQFEIIAWIQSIPHRGHHTGQ